ncbi:unnamed protein product, partial [Ectocarpus sp. 6 AP-2014]
MPARGGAAGEGRVSLGGLREPSFDGTVKDNQNTRLHSGLTLREGLLLLLRRGVTPRLDRAGRGGAGGVLLAPSRKL